MDIILLIILACCMLPVHCYKILYYSPKFGRSHVIYNGNIADILVEAGHDVVSVKYSVLQMLSFC